MQKVTNKKGESIGIDIIPPEVGRIEVNAGFVRKGKKQEVLMKRCDEILPPSMIDESSKEAYCLDYESIEDDVVIGLYKDEVNVSQREIFYKFNKCDQEKEDEI